MHPLLLFDIDGTLLDFCPSHRQALEAAVSRIWSIPGDISRLNCSGMTDWQIALELCRLEQIPEPVIAAGIPYFQNLCCELFMQLVIPVHITFINDVRVEL